jgi:RNA polymerase sigma factor (sigma-70 family)
MAEPSDRQLLTEYVSHNSQEAFATLVRRHVNLVYAAAFRQVGDFHKAQEITQVVFLILAAKAGRLKREIILSGWLYQTARLASASFLRSERRRQHREHEAFMQSTLNDSPAEPGWEKLAPLLDEAMGRLGEMDRNAIVLRFFEVRPVSEVAAALGLEEWAVRKRLERAVEKLQKFFTKRGIAISAVTICAALSASAAQAAPPATLAVMVAATAATKGAAATSSTLTLLKTTLKIMAWTKAKTLVTGAIVIACIATTTTLVIQHQPQLPKPQPVSPTETNFPKDSWVFAGYADPQSALLSSIWAQTKSDNHTFLTSLSPEAKQKRQQEFNYRMTKTGKTAAELFAEDSRNLDKTTGFRIIGQEIDSGNGILLHLYVQGNEMNIDAKMVKVGNEWKFDDFINQKSLAPNKQP